MLDLRASTHIDYCMEFRKMLQSYSAVKLHKCVAYYENVAVPSICMALSS